MANLRELKKEIDYRLEEVVFDCDMAIAFQPSKEQEIFELMQKAVALRNELIAKVSNPTEPHNKSLVRKYYAALRADIVRGIVRGAEQDQRGEEVGECPFSVNFAGGDRRLSPPVRIPADPSAVRRGVPLAIEGAYFRVSPASASSRLKIDNPTLLWIFRS